MDISKVNPELIAQMMSQQSEAGAQDAAPAPPLEEPSPLAPAPLVAKAPIVQPKKSTPEVPKVKKPEAKVDVNSII